MAFEAGCFIPVFYVAFKGIMSWHVAKTAHSMIPKTPQGRLFGYLEEGEMICAVNFAFQTWNFVISLPTPELTSPIILGHHLLAALVAWCGLHYQYLHYYGVYFLGLTEVSTVPLVFIDLAGYFPVESGSWFDTFVGAICNPLFALTFTIYRVVLWWKVSLLLWSDVRQVFKTGMVEMYRPGKSFVLYIFMVCNTLLSVLQLYWFGIIVGEVMKALQ